MELWPISQSRTDVASFNNKDFQMQLNILLTLFSSEAEAPASISILKKK